MTYEPLGCNYFIKPYESELPPGRTYFTGKVIIAGRGEKRTGPGQPEKPLFIVGDKVAFVGQNIHYVSIDGDKCYLVDERDILWVERP